MAFGKTSPRRMFDDRRLANRIPANPVPVWRHDFFTTIENCYHLLTILGFVNGLRPAIGWDMAVTRILLVEDERNLGELLVHVLLSAGFAVDLAATVAEAEHWLTTGDYRLVITDWRLPDGDGIALADRAAGLGMNTAVLTGYAFHVSPEKAARHEVWLKPIRPVELVAAIERCIGRDERFASN